MTLRPAPLRVAVVAGEFPALSETFVLDHVRTLAEAGAEVTVIAQRARSGEQLAELAGRLGVGLCYLGMPRRRTARALGAPLRFLKAPRGRMQSLARSIDAFTYGRTALSLDLFYSASAALPEPPRFDILHCHFGDCAIRGMFLCESGLLEARRLVATLHGAEDRVGVRPLRRLFRTADLLLPVSHLWSRHMESLGCPPDKLRVHHLGIDCARFRRPQPTRQNMAGGDGAARGGVPETRIVTVCRLAEKKGISDSFAALARLSELRPTLQFSFTVVGDGPLRSRLEAEAREQGLADRVTFTGGVPHEEVPRLLAGADLFLHPSTTDRYGEREGIPVSIMEAMASGLPVISTRHGGIPELVEDEVSGILVGERDPAALAEAILRLAGSAELCRRMGEAGRLSIERSFNRAQQDRELLAIYGELLGQAQRGAAGRRSLRTMEVL